MSDCGFCVSSGDCDGDGQYFGSKLVRSRSLRHCEECGKPIPKGELSVYHRGKGDNGMWQAYVCPVCNEIAETFTCDGGWIFGSFWDSFDENISAVNLACFERLSSPEAKAEIQRRWIEWKFSSWTMRKARERVAAILERARKAA